MCWWAMPTLLVLGHAHDLDRTMRLRQHSVLPGFGLTMGFTVLYLSLVVILPISALMLET
jgi:hypothetical protein